MKNKIILLLFLLVGCQQHKPVSIPQPLWRELSNLLGKHKDSPQVKKFTIDNHLKKYSKGSSGGFSNYGKVPYSLLFRQNVISRINIRVSNPPNYSNPVFTEKLPYNLKPEYLPEDVINKLGKPSHHPYREYINYQSLGMVVSFWKNNDGISEISLDLKESKQ
ncbi:hypothetical protein PQO03_07645 [Lentisphaera profundi]|uniref:Lipoprotein n=1 Tax=Lentisphaera profundi TaxID=1658616 RepID=A0ABY7VRS8_9BACT|nr:hypothetical protein [Lentisphaera profundi]WDE95592.1 hypothetical protein PQO03_07645 [Lentisphaera profundi]